MLNRDFHNQLEIKTKQILCLIVHEIGFSNYVLKSFSLIDEN